MRIFKYIFDDLCIDTSSEAFSLMLRKEAYLRVKKLLISYRHRYVYLVIGFTGKHSSIFKSSRNIQLKYRKLENLKWRYQSR